MECSKRFPKISRLYLITTRNCNLRCKYCYIKKENKNMPYSVAKDAVDFAAQNARRDGCRPGINYFGGEPLLRWDDLIVPITLYIRKVYGNEFSLSMTSNGVLLDREKLEFMKRFNISLLFSMDGNKVTQDINRLMCNGKSSFDILDKKIPMILEYYPNLRFRSTLDRSNINDLVNNHRYAVDKGFRRVYTAINVFADWDNEDKRRLKEQIRKLAYYYIELKRNGINTQIYPFQSMLDYIGEKDYTIDQEMNRLPGCGLGCGATASVGIDGSVYSCQEFVSDEKEESIFKIGNIYEGVSDNARQTLKESYLKIPKVCSDEMITCKSCPLEGKCTFGCVLNNYKLTGNLSTMPSIVCYYHRSLYDISKEIHKSWLSN